MRVNIGVNKPEQLLHLLTMLDLSYIIQDMTKTERTEERRNRFNGESVMLTKEEARRHDCIFIAESLAEFHTDPDVKDKHYKIMREHLNWFMKHNAKAYMVLLD